MALIQYRDDDAGTTSTPLTTDTNNNPTTVDLGLSFVQVAHERKDLKDWPLRSYGLHICK